MMQKMSALGAKTLRRQGESTARTLYLQQRDRCGYHIHLRKAFARYGRSRRTFPDRKFSRVLFGRMDLENLHAIVGPYIYWWTG